jgi:BASS family bile acid:Na+ symporter
MVSLGAIAGLATGGVPAEHARTTSTVALALAMTFSLTEVRFAGLSAREELRPFARALALNYGLLSGVILGLAFLYADPDARNGFVVMAAVPSAVAVIPITSLFRGNVQRALVTSALLYLAAFALTPLITLAFAGEAASPLDLGLQLVLLVAIPLAASRALARSPLVRKRRPVLVNACFFVLVMTLSGANRGVFVDSPGLVLGLAAGAFVRTWVVGGAVYVASARLVHDRSVQIADSLFASLKNLGLAALLGLALFSPLAALPAIISIFLEIAWVIALGRRFG